MGNQQCLPSRSKRHEDEKVEKPFYPNLILGTENLLAKELSQAESNDKLLDELLYQTQQHNLELLKSEFHNDINLFVLNNLLLTVQFFENFDKAIAAAKSFKHEVENQIAEKLSPLANDGVIHGDRRCFLIHGLPNELAKNFIFVEKREKYNRKTQKSTNEQLTIRHKTEVQNCQSIMPLEFILLWDNLEVHKESDWEMLKDYEYSSAKGSVAISRFCMEESNSKNSISKGFVRLRCVDVPKSLQSNEGNQFELAAEHDYDYSHFSDFNDAVDEVRTDSDVNSSEDDEYPSGHAMLRGLENRIQGWSQNSPSFNGKTSNIPNDKFPSSVLKLGVGERRPSGVLPFGFQKLRKESKPGSHSIPRQQDSILSPDFQIKRNKPKVLPKLGANGNVAGQHQLSSGYESSSALSHGSSLLSEDIREKWRKVEIKKLWQFPPKRRKPNKAPIHENCFLEVAIARDPDNEVTEESDSDFSDSKSTEGESQLDSDAQSIHRVSEPIYERRTYLNSVAFSSDFFSEFMQIGSQMGISADSLQNAIVVGATIKCAVSQPGLENSSTLRTSEKDSFNFLYTFTPSVQSKCLPQLPLIWWKRKMLAQPNKIDEEKWPKAHHIESIESVGANIIPLGSRSINHTQYQNVKQTLEWQVGYSQAENILLSSFGSVHWRALLFAALIYRAFLETLGPLGIGLEHFRNTLYHMCHQHFSTWNDIQPGLHVLSLLQSVYIGLSQGMMQNFFIRDHNMLRNIPIQNSRLVQAELNKVQDNIIIHFMFALWKLKPLRTDLYGMPNLLELYKIITTRNEKDLLQWVITNNPFHTLSRFGSSQGTIRKKKKVNKKKRRQQKRENLIKQNNIIDAEFGIKVSNGAAAIDKHREKVWRARSRWEERQNKKELLQTKPKKNQQEIGKGSENSSIFDLAVTPVKKFHYSSVREALLLKFFIRRFIHMAEKSSEFHDYCQAAMYVLHVENLCEMLSEISTEAIDAQEYKDMIKEIRDRLGPQHIREYIQSKNSKLSRPEETIDPLSSLPIKPTNSGQLSSNIILGQSIRYSRELPDPPKSTEQRPRLDVPQLKKVATPNFMQSLRSIPVSADNPLDHLETPFLSSTLESTLPLTTPALIPRAKDPSLQKQHPIKFIERTLSRKVSSASDSSSQEESTDL